MSIDDDSVKLREKVFHDERYEQTDDPRKRLSKYYSTISPANHAYRNEIERHHDPKGRTLAYGCGDKFNLKLLRRINCDFHGIDISPVAIEKAQALAADADFPAQFVVGDAERTEYPSDHFHLLYGSGILHHLDITQCMKEISRLLEPTGSCVFIEPLGHNPAINLFRKLTPSLRTDDEHPLRSDDFETFATYFERVNVHYFGFLSLGAVVFKKTPIYRRVLKRLVSLDDALVSRVPSVGKFFWMTVIAMEAPIAGQPETVISLQEQTVLPAKATDQIDHVRP